MNKTNFDYLREDIGAMAEALLNASADGCPPETEGDCGKDSAGWDGCQKCWLKWLKKEADI